MALWNRTLTIMYLGLAALGTLWVEGLGRVHTLFSIWIASDESQQPDAVLEVLYLMWHSNLQSKTDIERERNWSEYGQAVLRCFLTTSKPQCQRQWNHGILSFLLQLPVAFSCVFLGDVQSWEDLRWEFPMLSIEINSPCHDWIPAQLAIIKDSKTERAWSRTFFSLCCIHSLSTCH